MGSHDLAGMIHDATTWVLPILFAITLHEAAHGFVALLCGDRTAYMLGRVSANPLKHVDPIGTILLPALMFFTGGFLFGYAKPVPVNYRNLRHPRRDSVLVAAAGPVANILIATISALLMHVAVFLQGAVQDFVAQTLWNSMQLNVWLALFNLIPIPPLDGGRVAVGILPKFLALPLAGLERYGMMILIGLIILGSIVPQLSILGWILRPASSYVLTGIAHLTGIGDLIGMDG